MFKVIYLLLTDKFQNSVYYKYANLQYLSMCISLRISNYCGSSVLHSFQELQTVNNFYLGLINMSAPNGKIKRKEDKLGNGYNHRVRVYVEV